MSPVRAVGRGYCCYDAYKGMKVRWGLVVEGTHKVRGN